MADPFTHHIAVRYGEVDPQRVVFNAHYLAWCDDAMETWMVHLGVDTVALGWDFMVKKAVIEWQGAAALREHVHIDVAVVRWGTTSFDVSFSGRTERPVFTATITYVGVVPGTLTTAPPPAAVRERLGGPAPG